MFIRSIFALFFLLAIGVAAMAPDSLGVVGTYLLAKLSPYGIGPREIAGAMAFILAVVWAAIRALQRYLQGRTTIWKFANNKLTTSLLNRVIGHLLGKTTLLYEAKIVCDDADRPAAIAEAARITAQHLLRKNGSDMLRAFADVVGKK